MLTAQLVLVLVPAALLSAGLGHTAPSSPGWTPKEGRSLLGTAAPEWAGLRWIQGGPTTLASLRGKVVLLRFWLVGCPYCTRSAPALRELWHRHKDQGLVVVGLHHPKSPESENPAEVARAARALGFEFPIATEQVESLRGPATVAGEPASSGARRAATRRRSGEGWRRGDDPEARKPALTD